MRRPAPRSITAMSAATRLGQQASSHRPPWQKSRASMSGCRTRCSFAILQHPWHQWRRRRHALIVIKHRRRHNDHPPSCCRWRWRRRPSSIGHPDQLDACSGLPLRLVEAIFSSSFSLMDSSMLRDAPFSLLLGVSPRLADSAAPAAFCCAADLAGMTISHFTAGHNDWRRLPIRPQRRRPYNSIVRPFRLWLSRPRC